MPSSSVQGLLRALEEQGRGGGEVLVMVDGVINQAVEQRIIESLPIALDRDILAVLAESQPEWRASLGCWIGGDGIMRCRSRSLL